MTTTVSRRLGVPGAGLRAVSTLPALLDDCELVPVSPLLPAPALDGVLAWGQRPSARRAAAFAQRHGLPLVRIEDGFLRSVGLGADAPPLSIVIDDIGMYFDARAPSRLEALVHAGVAEDGAARAEALRVAWCRARVSKYNHARDDALDGRLPERFVLVVDQTAGDASIAGGLADAAAFPRMLAAALHDHPESVIVLKVHPDVVAGRKRGHFDPAALAAEPRVRVVADVVHPVTLLAGAEAVYVVTSLLGFEALLHGRPVHTFGMPFYAGWGLTRDALPAPARRRRVRLVDLVHAALIAYPRYLDPESGARCDVERLLDWMALQRRCRERFPAHVHAKGFAPWKLAPLRRFMAGSCVNYRPLLPLPAAAVVAVWGRRQAVAGAAKTLIVEDGFLRSVGLGADLVQPLSWVIDDVGIYYDATRPSRLEMLLQDHVFEAGVLARAALLRAAICAAGVTKYNLAGRRWQRPVDCPKVILVPGQVETDASITWGAPGIARNIDLLRKVRAENPGARVLYKPHPDVVAGVRRRGVDEARAAEDCDEVIVDTPIAALFDVVDEVHVLTSLAGFEALLRGKRVVCHGMPFYAGWGLTEDRVRCERRNRRLSLDELVAAALILYPTYVSRVSGAYTTPERALQEVVTWRNEGVADGRLVRTVRRWLVGLVTRLRRQ